MATINNVEVQGDKNGNDYGLANLTDLASKVLELTNMILANESAIADNLSEINLHKANEDRHVTPALINSLVRKEVLGLYYTAAQVAEMINDISVGGGAHLKVVDELPETGLEQIIYLVPNGKSGDNVKDEYIWIDNKWEVIGSTSIDLTNYVTNTDFATSNKGGVIKFSQSHGITMSSDGFLMGSTRTAEQYTSNSGNMLINKGTLENVFTNKNFVSNPDLETKLTNYAKDSDVVHLIGTETVDGYKSFLKRVTVTPSAAGTIGYYIIAPFSRGDTTIPSTNHATFRVQDKDNAIIGEVCFENSTDGNVAQMFNIRNTNDDGAQVSSTLVHSFNKDASNDVFYANRPGVVSLGKPDHKWSDVQTEKINGESVVTPTYLETKAENWQFTLSDGSTVAKKIVCL